jgi:hypothetical protein
MPSEVVEHAARILCSLPGRTLDARLLYERVSRDTGVACGLQLFLDALSANQERFAMLHPAMPPGDSTAWTAAERLAYAPALAAAGMGSAPLVTLFEDPAGTGDDDALIGVVPYRRDRDAALADVHRSVAELLRAHGRDPDLREAASAAMAALDPSVALRKREAGRAPRNQRRSSTLHHCSSASSASTAKPAARAESRMSGASSSRIPERMAQPPGGRER